MVYPKINFNKFMVQNVAAGAMLFFYAYNWNVISHNVRLRNFRYFFPLIMAFGYGKSWL